MFFDRCQISGHNFLRSFRFGFLAHVVLLLFWLFVHDYPFVFRTFYGANSSGDDKTRWCCMIWLTLSFHVFPIPLRMCTAGKKAWGNPGWGSLINKPAFWNGKSRASNYSIMARVARKEATRPAAKFRKLENIKNIFFYSLITVDGPKKRLGFLFKSKPTSIPVKLRSLRKRSSWRTVNTFSHGESSGIAMKLVGSLLICTCALLSTTKNVVIWALLLIKDTSSNRTRRFPEHQRFLLSILRSKLDFHSHWCQAKQH